MYRVTSNGFVYVFTNGVSIDPFPLPPFQGEHRMRFPESCLTDICWLFPHPPFIAFGAAMFVAFQEKGVLVAGGVPLC